jgi:hypothetical protein
MTLFDGVSKEEIFAEAIATFYPDGKDPATIEYAKDEGLVPRRRRRSQRRWYRSHRLTTPEVGRPLLDERVQAFLAIFR